MPCFDLVDSVVLLLSAFDLADSFVPVMVPFIGHHEFVTGNISQSEGARDAMSSSDLDLAGFLLRSMPFLDITSSPRVCYFYWTVARGG